MGMPATRAALAARPTTRIDWGHATGINGSELWGSPLGSAWTSGTTYLPFDSATPSTGDSPTSYSFAGRDYPALAADSAIVNATVGGDEVNHRAIFYDLLWVGPIIASTSSQTIGSGTLPTRDAFGAANGEGCILVAWGTLSTAVTITATYTNSAGVGSRAATVTTGARSGPHTLSLDTADTGVKAVASCQSSTADPYRIAIVRRIAVAQRPKVTISGLGFGVPTSAHATSRLHNLAVVPAGAVIFPQFSVQGSSANLPRMASLELAVL